MTNAIKISDGELAYYPEFLTQDDADELLTFCLTSLDWQQPEINMFGKRVKIPRLQAWIGDPQASYTYSGTQFTPRAWPDKLQQLNKSVSLECKTEFNSVLVNLYRDGNDAMGWHRDNEKELGDSPTIASVSLGQQRTFDLQHMDTKEIISIEPAHGSLIIMGGAIQTHWKHRVKREKKRAEPRVNLTFRRIIY